MKKIITLLLFLTLCYPIGTVLAEEPEPWVPGPKRPDRMIYVTTEKGKEFLKLYNTLQRMLDDKTSLTVQPLVIG